VCQQCNSLRAITYTPDDGLCENETCLVAVEEGHEIGVVKLGTAQKTALETAFVYIYEGHSSIVACVFVAAVTFYRAIA
jgi:hypothetical protein